MLYRVIISFCPEVHINLGNMCGLNAEFLNDKVGGT